MELVVLGSGSAFASGDRGQAGYLLHHDGSFVLLDAGPGTVGRLARAGYRPEHVDAVFLTHWHPDHVSDLVPFLFNVKHAPAPRATDLHVHGPSGFTGVFDGLMTIFGQWCVGELYDVVPIDVERDAIAVGALSVTAFPVRHGVPALGYRVEGGSRVVAITGDTGPCEALVELARGADVLVADATLPASAVYDGHLTAAQAGMFAARAGVGTLLLSHLSPESDTEEALADAGRAFGGRVAKAEDLLTLAL